MAWRELGERLKRWFAADAARPHEQGGGMALKRNRAEAIAQLRPEVRRVQQAIMDLDETERVLGEGDLTGVDGRRSALQGDLDRVQRELARYQDRI